MAKTTKFDNDWTTDDEIVGQTVTGRDVSWGGDRTGVVRDVIHNHYADGSVRGIDRARIVEPGTGREHVVYI